MAREPLEWADPASALAPIFNMYAYFRQFLTVPGVEGEQRDGLLSWSTGIPVAWFNGVLAERPARPDDLNTVETAIQFFRGKAKKEMSWWLSPYIPSTGWNELFGSKGFSYRDDDPGMRIDLGQLPKFDLPDGLRIVPVISPEETRIWVEQNFRGFGNPRNLVDVFYKLAVGMGFDGPLLNYLGYLGDQPVASSALFLGAGAAGVYYVSTQDEFRGRGIGSAMTLCPLIAAREMGYHVGVLQASKMGFPIYQKLGFETTCNNGYYYLSLTDK